MIKIIQKIDKDNPFLVIYKPKNIPSAPINNYDRSDCIIDAFSQAAELFPELKNVPGRQNNPREHGLLHRLDTVTSGLILIAANQEVFDFFQQKQKEGQFVKYYRAKCRFNQKNAESLKNFPVLSDFAKNTFYKDLSCGQVISISSRFRSFGVKGREVRPVTQNSGMAALKKSCSKEYRTEITIEKYPEFKKLVDSGQYNEKFNIICRITEGFRHQIRCHLGWIGLPIAGDELYDFLTVENSSKNDRTAVDKEGFDFEAFKIEFPHPFTGKKITIIN